MNLGSKMNLIRMVTCRLGTLKNEKYTLIFKTVFTRSPRFNIGVMRKNAYIDGQAWIVETANPDKVIAKLEINNCPGRTFLCGNDYDTGEHASGSLCYGRKEGLARYFRKNME